MTVTGLPDFHTLVSLVREHGPGVLDQCEPIIDELADATRLAEWTGLKPGSIYRMSQRTLSDGSPEWPEQDDRFGNSKVWRYRTIVVHRAAAPGRGAPGRPRPPRRQPAPIAG